MGQTAGADLAGNPSDAEFDAKSVASSVGTISALPVVVHGKVPECFMCRRKANEKSPLSSASAADPWGMGGGGYVQWTNYTKVRNRDGTAIGKTPIGSTCLISRNVYKAIGYQTKYGPLGQYKKVILASKDA